jgi:hypothetical protein
VFYAPNALFKGLVAVDKLTEATKTTTQAKEWLSRQVFYQLYLPPPKRTERGHFTVTTPNECHQANLLYFPHDRYKGKTYKYALIFVDIDSRYKAAEPITSKTADEVAKAFSNIYKNPS